jgi:23S rRNA (guanosine2251-2'-O)-methyltransferase
MTREPDDAAEGELVYGYHAVMELLETRGSEVERVLVALERQDRLGRLLKLCRTVGVPVSRLPRRNLAARVAPGAAHQGVAAQVAERRYDSADEISARAAADPQAILILADRVVDPRNLGSILRTAAAAGAHGLFLGGAGTVGLTPAVLKVSGGAAERFPVAREGRPARRIAGLRERGFRAFALDPRGESPWDREPLTGRLLLVVGGEERGVSNGVVRECDRRVAIPMHSGAESLNVAVALGVLLFEAVRQRRLGARQGS